MDSGSAILSMRGCFAFFVNCFTHHDVMAAFVFSAFCISVFLVSRYLYSEMISPMNFCEPMIFLGSSQNSFVSPPIYVSVKLSQDGGRDEAIVALKKKSETQKFLSPRSLPNKFICDHTSFTISRCFGMFTPSLADMRKSVRR